MSTYIERGFLQTHLMPEDTGLLRPIGIDGKFLERHPRIEMYVDGSNLWWKNKRKLSLCENEMHSKYHSDSLFESFG